MYDVISANAPDHKVRVVHYSDTKFALLYNGQYITLQNFLIAPRTCTAEKMLNQLKLFAITLQIMFKKL